MRRHGSDGRRAASQAIAGEVGDWLKGWGLVEKLGVGQKIGSWLKKEVLDSLAKRQQNWKFHDGTRRDPRGGAGQGANYCLVPANDDDDDDDDEDDDDDDDDENG